jgi:hypothetical protein
MHADGEGDGRKLVLHLSKTNPTRVGSHWPRVLVGEVRLPKRAGSGMPPVTVVDASDTAAVRRAARAAASMASSS